MPVEVFRHTLMTQMTKHVRPPTRRDLGKKIHKLKPIFTCRAVVEEMLSVARGLPAEDQMSGILRLTPGGVVKPTRGVIWMDGSAGCEVWTAMMLLLLDGVCV